MNIFLIIIILILGYMVYKCHFSNNNNKQNSGIDSIKKLINLPIDFIKKLIPF
jgi:hypothetical protein